MTFGCMEWAKQYSFYPPPKKKKNIKKTGAPLISTYIRLTVKGTVQRKLRGVKSGFNQ
jgi:hypothetical protein